MPLVNKIKTLANLNQSEQKLCAEAFVYLAWARFLKLFRFKHYSRSLGTWMAESSFEDQQEHFECVRGISSAIHLMSKYTFWESECLVKAIAGMKMLHKRGIASTLYLGTAKDENGKMIAHAWLRSGTYFICGAEEKGRFTAVSKFSRIE